MSIKNIFKFSKKNKHQKSMKRTFHRLKPDSPTMEAYRVLRTNIEFSGTTKKMQTILLTSSVAQEGKSTTACNLAKAFAYTGIKTLLLDFDFRRPTLHNYFMFENTLGSMDHLLGKITLEEAIKSTEVENLYLLNTGVLPPDPAEILASSRMETIVNQLRESFGIIIIDTPPATVLADAAIASRLADAVILVSSVEKTRTDDLEMALNNLRASGAKLHGVIINNVTKHTRGHKHYSYYAKYY